MATPATQGPQGTALLVMDVIDGIISRLEMDQSSGYLAKVSAAIAAARANKIPVIHVTLGFRPGYPELSPRNKLYGMLNGTGFFVPSSSGAPPNPSLRFPDEVAPLAGEVVVSRSRVSAFAGTDLELVLRSQGIQKLVLTGLSTSGVVLSTLRDGMDLDYDMLVLEDLCGDRDDEVHRVLTQKVFPISGEVSSSSQWIESLKGSAEV